MSLSRGREMEAISCGRGLARILVSVAVLLIGNIIPAYADECSIAKTNASCTLTIDRRNPLAPSDDPDVSRSDTHRGGQEPILFRAILHGLHERAARFVPGCGIFNRRRFAYASPGFGSGT